MKNSPISGDLVLCSGLEQQLVFDYYSVRDDIIKQPYVMNRPRYWQDVTYDSYVRLDEFDTLFASTSESLVHNSWPGRQRQENGDRAIE